jgi:hypothetical protein
MLDGTYYNVDGESDNDEIFANINEIGNNGFADGNTIDASE